jgi:lipopolysaccharide export system permease protein
LPVFETCIVNHFDYGENKTMIIFRYLTKEVYATLLAATFVVLLVVIANQFINYLGRAAAGGLPMKAVMQLMSLEMPVLLGYLLPLALFIGILLAYGRLYTDHEMTVLFSCGFSKTKLLVMTLLLSSFIAIIIAVLTLWVEPKLAWYRDRVFAEAAIASPIETVLPGRFQTLNRGQWVFYVGSVSRDHTSLQDVFVAKSPDVANPTWTIVSAQGGHSWIDPKTGDHFIVLTNGHRYTGLPGERDFQVAQYEQYGMRVQTGNLYIPDQTEFTPTTTLWKERHHNRDAATELQWRLTMPLAAMILAWLAVPLSHIKPRKGRYAKLLPAILIYVVYADLIFVIQAAVKKGSMPPLPGMLWIHGAMALLALILTEYFIGWQSIKNTFTFKRG